MEKLTTATDFYRNIHIPKTEALKSAFGAIASDMEFWLVIGVWLIHFLLLAAPFPFNYDSVNLALAIEDKIDITRQQPQPPGFLFQVLLGRLVHLFVADPFTVLEVQGMIYLAAMLLFLRMAPSRRQGDLLLCGTTPLFLFFTGAPIMQSASVAFGAGIAYLVVKARTTGRGHPVLLAVFTAIGTGFRYDVLMFLGPVALLGMAASKPSWRQWLIAAVLFLAIGAAWYVPVSALSGWASPYRMTKEMQQTFTSGISLACGGSAHENLRCALRFLLYFPGVFGIGGLTACAFFFAGKQDRCTAIALAGAVPFFLAGIILYMPLPQYYAPVAGFVMALVLFAGKLPSSRKIATFCIAGNLLFFWLMPQPIQPAGRFHDRDLFTSSKKQLSFIGANSAAVLLYNNELLRTAETVCGRCGSFYSPLLWDRMWRYMALKRWHNRYTLAPDSADCLIVPSDSINASGRRFCRNVRFERRRPCTGP